MTSNTARGRGQNQEGPESTPRGTTRARNSQGQNGGWTGSAWFQCVLVAAVSAAVFAVFYYPSLRSGFIPQRGSGLKWWQSSIIYQIYPRSFKDSNGDGVGDLKGIIEKLDYFTYLGVEAIWISPIYKSPMVDMGYDVQDYRDIDSIFGTMDDFEELLSAAHAKGIKMIMDFIPNHTSDKHKWFQKSRQGGDNNPYKDYYIWDSGKQLPNGTRAPPNNWVSCFGGSMWEWDDTRGQYYLHQFATHQPDLNFRNPRVQQEILDALKFWVVKGVDGFRVDAVRHMYEVADLAMDEPRSNQPNTTPDQYEYYNHLFTSNLPEIHDVLRTWRDYFDNYNHDTGHEVFMVLEIFDTDPKKVVPYYHSGANFPFNFNLQSLNNSCDGFCYKELVDSWVSNVPDGKWSNWVMGSHDVRRISGKIGVNYVNALNMILLLLPGTPVTYNGEEIGMENAEVTFEQTQDVFGLNFGPDRYAEFTRDPERTPMQWNADKNAGFSNGDKTWLPVHPNYITLNVKVQQESSKQSSVQLYKHLAALRKQRTFQHGGFQFAIVNKNIFSFIRYYKDDPAYLVAINIGKESSTDNYREYSGGVFPTDGIYVPYRGYLVHNTGTIKSSDLQERALVLFEKITLHPGDGIVVRFWPHF